MSEPTPEDMARDIHYLLEWATTHIEMGVAAWLACACRRAIFAEAEVERLRKELADIDATLAQFPLAKVEASNAD